jgi:hypothetical protein
LETAEETMQKAFEQLAHLVGNLLAERWLSETQSNVPADTDPSAEQQGLLAPKDAPGRVERSASSPPDCGPSS